MSETPVEQNIDKNNLLKEYGHLNSRFPLGDLSEASNSHKSSFPDWKISDEERAWANSYLGLGNNREVLEIFGKSVGYIGTRGLQLLREQSTKKERAVLEDLGKNMTLDSLLGLLRNKFQSDTLFYEEGLRGARNVEDDYWFGEGDQLAIARHWLVFSGNACREMNEFRERKTGRLYATKRLIDANYNAMKDIADHNENFYRENLGDGLSPEGAELSAKKDAKNLVFWSSLKGFVDNLELMGGQGNKD